MGLRNSTSTFATIVARKILRERLLEQSSRAFRHSCIFVNADAGIVEPRDLVGKRIGTPEFQMTAPVWIRGKVINRMEAGTSTVIAVHALQAKLPVEGEETAPLVYHNRTWHALGPASALDG